MSSVADGIVDRFSDDVLAPTGECVIPGSLRFALGGQIFGPYLADMTNAALERVASGSLDPELAAGALAVVGSLYTSSEQGYFDNEGIPGYERRPITDDPDALERHQQNVRSGVIELIDPQYWTTHSYGEEQVAGADIALGSIWDDRLSKVQPLAAALNYGTNFNIRTMADGTLTLARTDIEGLLETESLEAMNHLTITNWAIGQTVATIYESLAITHGNKSHLNIVDLCSGSGATLAATTNSLKHKRGYSLAESRPTLSGTAVDVTPELFLGLMKFAQSDFATRSMFRDVDYARGVPEFGDSRLQLVNADVFETIYKHFEGLFGEARPNQVDVVSANFGWHRMSSEAKRYMLERFAQRPNIAVLIGDLAYDGSDVNRGYFNLSANAPLNAGNMDLVHLMRDAGFKVVDLAKQVPAGLDRRLVDRILRERENDMHYWIAYKGELTENALALAT